MKLRKYPRGGHVRGPGTATSDSIHAMLSDGEYVLPAATTEQIGKGALDQLVLQTNGKPPVGMATGGLAGLSTDEIYRMRQQGMSPTTTTSAAQNTFNTLRMGAGTTPPSSLPPLQASSPLSASSTINRTVNPIDSGISEQWKRGRIPSSTLAGGSPLGTPPPAASGPTTQPGGGLKGVWNRYFRSGAPTEVPGGATNSPKPGLIKNPLLRRAVPPLAIAGGALEAYQGYNEGDMKKMGLGIADAAAGAASMFPPTMALGQGWLAGRGVMQAADLISGDAPSGALKPVAAAGAPARGVLMPPAQLPALNDRPDQMLLRGGDAPNTSGFVRTDLDRPLDLKQLPGMNQLIGNKGGKGRVYDVVGGVGPTEAQQRDALALAAKERGQLGQLATAAAQRGDRNAAYRMAGGDGEMELAVADALEHGDLQARAKGGSRRAQEALNSRAVQQQAALRTNLEHQDRRAAGERDMIKALLDADYKGKDLDIRRATLAHQRGVDERNFGEKQAGDRADRFAKGTVTVDPATGKASDAHTQNLRSFYSETQSAERAALKTKAERDAFDKRLRQMSPQEEEERIATARQKYALREVVNERARDPAFFGTRGVMSRAPVAHAPTRKSEFTDVGSGTLKLREYVRMKALPAILGGMKDEVQEFPNEEGRGIVMPVDELRERLGAYGAADAYRNRARGGILRKIR